MNSEFLQSPDWPQAPWLATAQALQAATEHEGAPAQVWNALGDTRLRAIGVVIDPLSVGYLYSPESSGDDVPGGRSMGLDAQTLQSAHSAGEAYLRALQVGGSSIEARRGLAVVQTLCGELDSIIDSLRARLTEDSRNIDLYFELSIILAFLGDAEAADIAGQAAATWPDSADAQRLFGWCLRAAGSPDRGAELLRRAAMRFAQHAGLALDVAMLSFDTWEDNETVRLSRRAVNCDRQSSQAWLLLAQACSRIEDWQATAEAASAALSIVANLPLGHCLLGTAQLEMDLPEAALGSLSRAFKESALWPEMKGYLAVALELADRHRDALELLVRWSGSKTSASVILARELRVRGRIERAVKCARQARLADPEDQEAQYELAECLLASGRSEEVRSMLARILVANASDWRACELMAVACRDAETMH